MKSSTQTHPLSIQYVSPTSLIFLPLPIVPVLVVDGGGGLISPFTDAPKPVETLFAAVLGVGIAAPTPLCLLFDAVEAVGVAKRDRFNVPLLPGLPALGRRPESSLSAPRWRREDMLALGR